MPTLSFERRVPYAPEQMLALVSDLTSYPDFVPNCTDMDIKDGNTPEERLARMSVSFGPIDQAYTSKVRVDAEACSVVAEAIDGPFSHLNSEWRFSADGEGSLVQFDIDFDFSNRLLAGAAGPVFSAKQGEIVDAFMAEAERRFG